jgi:hypothetical protein
VRTAFKILGKIVGGGNIPLVYLFRDEFTTDDAAPITSPRTCEPGPGTLTAAFQAGDQSISGGVLRFAATANLPQSRSGTRTLEAGDAYFVKHWYSGASRLMFGINSAALGDTPRWYVNSTVLTAYQGDGTSVSFGVVLSAETWYSLLMVARSVGTFHIKDGELWWVDTTNDTRTSRVLGISRSNAGAGNMDQRFDNASIIDLPDNGYSEWDEDFSTVTDSESAPANSTYFDHVADCHITSTFTFEAGKYYYIYFRGVTGLASWNRLRCLTGGGADLASHSGGTYWSSGGVFSDGVEYKIDIVCEGSTVKVYVDNVLKTTQTITENATNLRGRINYTLATNDIVLSTHPYPSLGIATDRVIAPQNAETRTTADDNLSYFRNYILGAGTNSHSFRYTTDADRCYLQIKANGEADFVERISGAANTRINTGAGTVSAGDDVCLILDGTDCEIFVNNSSAGSGTLTTHTSGTVMKTDVQFGNAIDSIEHWPRDVSSLLPASLV